MLAAHTTVLGESWLLVLRTHTCEDTNGTMHSLSPNCSHHYCQNVITFWKCLHSQSLTLKLVHTKIEVQEHTHLKCCDLFVYAYEFTVWLWTRFIKWQQVNDMNTKTEMHHITGRMCNSVHIHFAETFCFSGLCGQTDITKDKQRVTVEKNYWKVLWKKKSQICTSCALLSLYIHIDKSSEICKKNNN